ncbi:unnamed protein product [Prorocentrum cordatum]|uniref:C3H1-type domain-containing protein n=1 Tax=Prorocentrum cordatum TaxID=2364126 RepID=A0ABN9P8J3_9DINO|nr:unnamed protein product [Polarella glacialis]|mmetsp:Transcript_52270/g.145949  ORF Transcript_52270/g.145949 Transcript_52270/m.145949 type:complete len:251 (-) Transcript_52270:217-969(-)
MAGEARVSTEPNVWAIGALSAPPGVFVPPGAPAAGVLLSTEAPGLCAGHTRRPVLLAEPRFAGLLGAPAAKDAIPEKVHLPSLAGRAGPLHARSRALAAMKVEAPVHQAVGSHAAGPAEETAAVSEQSSADPEDDASSAAARPTGQPPAAAVAPPPGLGELALPSVGSQGHALGICKPCAFFFKDACESGYECKFCHLCPPGVKKLRKREWKQQRRTMRSGVPGFPAACALCGQGLACACGAGQWPETSG